MCHVNGIRAILESPCLSVDAAVGAAFATTNDGIVRYRRNEIAGGEVALRGTPIRVAVKGDSGATDVGIDIGSGSGDGQRVGRIEGELGPVSLVGDEIHVLDDRGSDLVDDTSLVAVEGGDARGQPIPERDIDHGVDAVTEVIGLGGILQPHLDAIAEAFRVGLFGDVADRPHHAALAIERALRPFQHLDALEVEVRKQRCPGACARNRCVVHVHRNGSGRRPELGDSACRDPVPGLRGVSVVQSGNRQEQVLDVLYAPLLDIDIRQCRDSHRRIHQLRVAVRGGNHDLLDQ